MTTSSRFAGAISSLTWNGKQFINSDDHGRELQSASSFDGLGECFNPTEAGSSYDGASSTSQLLGIQASGHQLKTTAKMAFWLKANSYYRGNNCGATTFKNAQNTTDLSQHKLSKQVTIGFAGIENVIEYLVTFNVPENHESAVFEALTGYMPTQFSSFFTYDVKQDILAPIPDSPPGEQSLPLIFSTPDQRHAMGIYSPDLPQANFPMFGYGKFSFISQNTVKWNTVFRTGATPTGDYSYRAYVVVGGLQQVKIGMNEVAQHFGQAPSIQDHSIGGVIDGIFGPADAPYIQGWACASHSDQSITVHLYLGGSAGSGTLVGGYPANAPSEPAISSACHSYGSAYRYNIPITAQMRAQFFGKSIYVHGIDPFSGYSNDLLGRSGEFKIP